MHWLRKIFPIGHILISLLFGAAAAALIVFAALALWDGIRVSHDSAPGTQVLALLEGIALLTVALAALELSETIFEEEVQRGAQMSSPTRVRRYLSRFMIVLVVALTIEVLVSVFRLAKEDPGQLPNVAAVGVMAAALLAAWGYFVQSNAAAERLEPEAMEKAKEEDATVDKRR